MEQQLGSIWSSQLSFGQKLIRLPLRLIPRSTTVRVLSGVNKGLKWIVGANVHQCWLGTYEKEKQAAMARDIKPGMVVWDIGANVGFYTIAFARLCGNNGRVLAFEPFGSNVGYLLKHVVLNKFTNVVIIQCALSSQGGLVPFSIGKHSSQGKIELTSSYRVPAMAVDQFIADGGGPMPDLIKIDVEGAEAAVLQGARGMLVKKRPVIWLALHGYQERKDCTEILARVGYNFFRLDGTKAMTIDTDEVIAK